MFRFIYKKFINNSSNRLLQHFVCNSTNIQTRQIQAMGIHEIHLTGKVFDIFEQKNGSIIFYMKSIFDNNKNIVHKVCITNPKVLSLLGDKLAAGRHVYVTGKMRTSAFMTMDDKQRQTVQIMANELYLCSDSVATTPVTSDSVATTPVTSDSTAATPDLNDLHDRETVAGDNDGEQFDENRVELFGTVASDIIIRDNFRAFSVGTTFTSRIEGGAEHTKYGYHRVFIFEEHLFNTIDNLKRSQQVIIHGDLNYSRTNDKNGRSQSIGYIAARRLFKIDELNKTKSFSKQSMETMSS